MMDLEISEKVLTSDGEAPRVIDFRAGRHDADRELPAAQATGERGAEAFAALLPFVLFAEGSFSGRGDSAIVEEEKDRYYGGGRSGSLYGAPESAYCLSDLVSSPQLRLARRLGREAGVDADGEAERLFGLRLGELSRAGAETVIERLRTLAAPRRGALRRAV